MAFFIESARDAWGSRMYGSQVIEAERIDDRWLRVIGPPEFARAWSRVKSEGFIEVSSQAGPARKLSGRGADAHKEMDHLIALYQV